MFEGDKSKNEIISRHRRMSNIELPLGSNIIIESQSRSPYRHMSNIDKGLIKPTGTNSHGEENRMFAYRRMGNIQQSPSPSPEKSHPEGDRRFAFRRMTNIEQPLINSRMFGFRRMPNIVQPIGRNTKLIVDILKKLDERSPEDLHELAIMLNNVQFFMEKDLSMPQLEIVANAMTYRFHKAGDIVVFYGDGGDEFFIILEGLVSVHAPTTKFGKFKEVSNLPTGSAFGELALITNQERSATIKCIKNSHFAVLDRKSYEIVLKNIEAQILKERTDLLHSIPCFKSCSLKAVQRITYYFKKLTFTSGQIVYKTNDRHTRIYVVKSGEFEYKMDLKRLFANYQSNLTIPDKEKKEATENYTRIETTPIAKTIQIHNAGDANIIILGKGQMFGEDDALYNRSHIATVCCRSAFGEIMAISLSDFFMMIQPITIAWSEILYHAEEKRNRIRSRIFELGNIKQKAKEQDDKNYRADIGCEQQVLYSTKERNQYFCNFLKSLRHKDKLLVKKVNLREKQKFDLKNKEKLAEIRRRQEKLKQEKKQIIKRGSMTDFIRDAFFLTAVSTMQAQTTNIPDSIRNLFPHRQVSSPDILEALSSSPSFKKLAHQRLTMNASPEQLLKEIPKKIRIWGRESGSRLSTEKSLVSPVGSPFSRQSKDPSIPDSLYNSVEELVQRIKSDKSLHKLLKKGSQDLLRGGDMGDMGNVKHNKGDVKHNKGKDKLFNRKYVIRHFHKRGGVRGGRSQGRERGGGEYRECREGKEYNREQYNREYRSNPNPNPNPNPNRRPKSAMKGREPLSNISKISCIGSTKSQIGRPQVISKPSLDELTSLFPHSPHLLSSYTQDKSPGDHMDCCFSDTPTSTGIGGRTLVGTTAVTTSSVYMPQASTFHSTRPKSAFTSSRTPGPKSPFLSCVNLGELI